uniref:Tail protein n=1 Tax=Dulem virus 31 TaxID=3145749 RepID=A0AAU8ATB6_9VIRU
MIKINDQIIEVVQDGVNWQGSKDTVARVLSFSVIYQPLDETFPRYNIKIGDKVEYIEKNKTYFYGYIEKISYTTDNGTIEISCCDMMKRLLNSKCVGRFRGTLKQLADKICGLFYLKNGIESNSTHVHNIVSTGDMSYYEILKNACDVMFARYALYLDGLTLKLAEHNSFATFTIGQNIRSSSFSQDMSDIVNKVLIIDTTGKLLSSVQDTDSINQFGLFQTVYTYDKDSKNNLVDAQHELKTIKNEGSIVVNNDNNCISGRFITVYEPLNNFNGLFEIVSDNHTIANDSVMTLDIELVEVAK